MTATNLKTTAIAIKVFTPLRLERGEYGLDKKIPPPDYYPLFKGVIVSVKK
ncbi:hypothetical protein GXM_05512 [Nostoc sphaeroides CCNUC1]|uniref:Uncharacterized protein n=1 Tax=Nostoc sphaeroides CCNUC1 TaxID=2653204 RepID=A0A5P8W5U2_9NOSO|nr:hypothetical protein GXM_05512 [Nostoc sphaeroides CCNUC1]